MSENKVKKLLEIASLKPKKDKPDRGYFNEAEKFAQALGVTKSERDKVLSSIIYEKYLTWRGKREAISISLFSRQFGKMFDSKNVSYGKVFLVDSRPFKLTQEEEISRKKKLRKQYELRNGKKEKSNKEEKDNKKNTKKED